MNNCRWHVPFNISYFVLWSVPFSFKLVIISIFLVGKQNDDLELYLHYYGVSGQDLKKKRKNFVQVLSLILTFFKLKFKLAKFKCHLKPRPFIKQ